MASGGKRKKVHTCKCGNETLYPLSREKEINLLFPKYGIVISLT
jgi:hypothetical protein